MHMNHRSLSRSHSSWELHPLSHLHRHAFCFPFRSVFESWRGHSLIELMLCMLLLTVLLCAAAPLWQPLLLRTPITLARDDLLNDVQTARLQALQLGTELTLTRSGNCAWASNDAHDWSCGWQLQRIDNQTVLRSHPLHTPMQVWIAKQASLTIYARGELGTVGTRWQISPLGATDAVSYVVCLNSAGRLRWRMGSTCS